MSDVHSPPPFHADSTRGRSSPGRRRRSRQGQVRETEVVYVHTRSRTTNTLLTLILVVLLVVFVGPLALCVMGIGAAGIATATFGNEQRARVMKAEKDCKVIFDASQQYMMIERRVPSPDDLLQSGYLLRLSTDPWGEKYSIREIGPRTLEVVSRGPDRAQGTDDDIVFPLPEPRRSPTDRAGKEGRR